MSGPPPDPASCPRDRVGHALRRAARWGLLGGAALAAACADGEGSRDPSAPVDSDPSRFCSGVASRVEAHLATAREAHPPPAGDPRYGGTVVVGGRQELAGGLNVAAATDYVAVQHQQFVNLMTLIRYGPDLEPEPWLAESWEVSDDGASLTFHLRSDVTWHDGEPTDAHDVAFTFRRLADPATGFPNASFWARYEGVEVLDDRAVRFRLEPHAGFLDPWRTVAILPEHLLGEVPPEELAGHPFGTECPVGNGPFVFREHRERDRWTFDANPAFPAGLGGRPFVDRYVYRIVPSANTLLLSLLEGEVDVYAAVESSQAQAIEEAPDVRLLAYPFRNVTFVAWNARRPQLAGREVRRALTLALDRGEIVRALLEGRGSVANATLPPFHWAYEADAGALPHDPAQATRLLAASGWRDRDGDGVREDRAGRPLRIGLLANQENDRLRRLAQIVQAQLREVGVAVDVEAQEWASMVARITDPGRPFDAALLSWVAEFHVDDTDLFHSDALDGPYAFSGTRNPELDSLIVALRAAVGQQEARPLWRAYVRELAREQPYTFLYFPDRLDGVRARVRNVEMDARGEWLGIARWWLDPAER